MKGMRMHFYAFVDFPVIIVVDYFRIPMTGLPEIRHKTAVSTIRSTAEKTAHRDKSVNKLRSDDSKKKPVQRREAYGRATFQECFNNSFN